MREAVRRLACLAPGEARALDAAHARGESPWLVSAKLKLVDGCNLRCAMCDYWKLDRRGEIGTAEVVAVLDDLAALGCRKVHFTGGEIFLRRDAVDLFRAAAERGMRVNLTTNGTVLGDRLVRETLRVPARSITLSVDSPVARVHDAIRGRRGALRRTLRAIDRLLRRRKKTTVRLNTVVSSRNAATLVEMPALLARYPVDAWLLLPMDPKGTGEGAMRREDILRYDAEIAPALEASVRLPGFDPWIYGRGAREAAMASRHLYALGRYARARCWAPWFHVLVGATGDVYPCCMGHREMTPLGNVRDRPLREIFAGAAYASFRRRMLARREAVCRRCDDFLGDNAAIDGVRAGWPT